MAVAVPEVKRMSLLGGSSSGPTRCLPEISVSGKGYKEVTGAGFDPLGAQDWGCMDGIGGSSLQPLERLSWGKPELTEYLGSIYELEGAEMKLSGVEGDGMGRFEILYFPDHLGSALLSLP